MPIPFFIGVGVGMAGMWIYKKFVDDDPPKKDPPKLKPVYLLYGMPYAGKSTLAHVDCAGANSRFNNDCIDQKLAKPNVGEKHLVYVFSAVQYSQNPEFAKKVQTDLEVYNDFAKDKWSIHEIFALGTHSPWGEDDSSPPQLTQSTHIDTRRIIDELSPLASVRIFELKDVPSLEIRAFLGVSQ